ncbi:MAG: hypothetical protein ABH896_00965 [Candidatus Jacksonbacteria bacterium]
MSTTVNYEKRKILSEKITDLSNIIAGAMIFGQFLADDKFNLTILIWGAVLTIIGYLVALKLYPAK